MRLGRASLILTDVVYSPADAVRPPQAHVERSNVFANVHGPSGARVTRTAEAQQGVATRSHPPSDRMIGVSASIRLTDQRRSVLRRPCVDALGIAALAFALRFSIVVFSRGGPGGMYS